MAEAEKDATDNYCPPTFVEIPIKDTDEVLRIDLTDLPSVEDILQILGQEESSVDIWLKTALLYHYNDEDDKYEIIAEKCVQVKTPVLMTNPNEVDSFYRLYSSLGAYCSQRGSKELKPEMKTKYFQKSASWYNMCERFTGLKTTMNSNLEHIARRAYLHLRQGSTDEADSHLNFVLSVNSNYIPALAGKAFMAFAKKDYRGSLMFFRKILRVSPYSRVNARIGIGHCFWKLGSLERAEEAFNRAVEVDPLNVQALAGLAICHLRKKEKRSIERGITLLARAYSIRKDNPVVLNYLADHFYCRGELEKAKELALYAFYRADVDFMKAHSTFHIGRVFQAMNNQDEAFQFYYNSSQLRSPTFVWSKFGLGQIYHAKEDIINAVQCLQAVLSVFKDHTPSLKILGSIYAHSSEDSKKAEAVNLLMKVVKEEAENEETWLELGLAKEHIDPVGALECYQNSYKIFQKKKKIVPVQVLNNIGALNIRANKLEIGKKFFEMALQRAQTGTSESMKEKGHSVTIKFNIGRTLEHLCEFVTAEKVYKGILKENPSYYSCFLRLGVIARDKNLEHEAQNYFKEALQASLEHPDAWCFIGNMHLRSNETNPAMKKFKRILEMRPELKQDSFSWIALGNIELYNMCHTSSDNKVHGFSRKALKSFLEVLKDNPNNIWATNGIGCVLAYQGHMSEANDMFSLVREGTADFKDVWINIAHTYVEQKMYISAIQMYENCLKKFYQNYDLEILQYIARAHYKNGNLKQAKLTLIKCLRICPEDNAVLFSLSKTLQKFGWETLRDTKATLSKALAAAKELSIALKYFKYIGKNNSGQLRSVADAANIEAQYCKDLITQSQYHIGRAQRADEEERLYRQRKEQEFEIVRQKQLEEKRMLEEKQRLEAEMLQKRREEFIEQKKHALVFDVRDESAKKDEDLDKITVPRKRGRKKKIVKGVGTPTSSDSEEQARRSKAKKARITKKGKKTRKTVNPVSSDSSDVDTEKAERKKLKPKQSRTSKKNSNRIKSVEVLPSATSSSENSDEERRKQSDSEEACPVLEKEVNDSDRIRSATSSSDSENSDGESKPPELQSMESDDQTDVFERPTSGASSVDCTKMVIESMQGNESSSLVDAQFPENEEDVESVVSGLP